MKLLQLDPLRRPSSFVVVFGEGVFRCFVLHASLLLRLALFFFSRFSFRKRLSLLARVPLLSSPLSFGTPRSAARVRACLSAVYTLAQVRQPLLGLSVIERHLCSISGMHPTLRDRIQKPVHTALRSAVSCLQCAASRPRKPRSTRTACGRESNAFQRAPGTNCTGRAGFGT